MGYMRHNAIVVTSSSPSAFDKVYAFAVASGACVTNVVDGVVNGYRSFMVCPDGSKEGWAQSEVGDLQRFAILDYIRTFAWPEDGSSPIDWVEVQFGDDRKVTEVVASGDDDQKAFNDA